MRAFVPLLATATKIGAKHNACQYLEGGGEFEFLEHMSRFFDMDSHPSLRHEFPMEIDYRHFDSEPTGGWQAAGEYWGF